jgi:AraC family transcriptional regulator
MIAQSGSLSEVAVRLFEAACFARDGNDDAVKAHIARAIALLRGDPSEIPTNPPPPQERTSVRGGLAAWQKRRVMDYINTHLDRSIRVEELGKLVNFSGSHFGRAFRRAFDTPTHEYLTRRRIEVAQSLMLTTQESLSEIALQCGLSDQSHFTRVFRRIVGETPCAWRRSRNAAIPDRSPKSSDGPTTFTRSSILSGGLSPSC